MNFRKFLVTVLATTIASISAGAAIQQGGESVSPRSVISLNGQWNIGQGEMAAPPDAFPGSIPVPGLVDMAEPPFADVGVVSPTRDAFWYKRTFQVDGPLPSVASLKIYKAAFGSQVILNGKKFEERWPSFTPLYTDVHDALVVGENVLLIRVGAHPSLLPEGVPQGYDVEKTRYIPGIYDSVDLILTGSPTITNVQTVPEIDKKQVRVQTLLKNDSGASTSTRVKFTVHEHKSGRIVGTGETTVNLPASGEETTATVTISITDCRLWSPEDPFLYDVQVNCESDQVTERFGMRNFRLDQATGRAYLNGETYFMRGSNITLYRFFEDFERGALPWDETWVRNLHKLVRDMHWNTLRYCIGFPPEFWYDIADEEGILIQDEFPIWTRKDSPEILQTEELVSEYTDWMRDRWNHPSVVLWDAQNETRTTITGHAISAVRHLDLSNRPWDNGYGKYRLPGDSFESHPYLFNKKFNNKAFLLKDLSVISGTPTGNHSDNTADNPIIINEYGWVWLNRDGTPSTLARAVYNRITGGKPLKVQERRHLHARLLAALTEFWRGNRACAGILHFCILGYSRPDGQTSDHFADVKSLRLDPDFQKHVRDAFAPVGIMIDFWDDRTTPGQTREIPVIVTNDLPTSWSGQVRLSLLQDDKPVSKQANSLEAAALGQGRTSFSLEIPTAEGAYQIRAEMLSEGMDSVSSWRDITVGPALIELVTTAGIAVGKPATASSPTAGTKLEFKAAHAFDGDLNTRWAAEKSVPEWVQVDLLKPTEISAIELVWEQAYAKAYHIEVSNDAKTWTRVYKTEDGYGAEPIIRFVPVTARYVRLTATKRGSQWGVSLFEMKVF